MFFGLQGVILKQLGSETNFRQQYFIVLAYFGKFDRKKETSKRKNIVLKLGGLKFQQKCTVIFLNGKVHWLLKRDLVIDVWI